MHASGVGESLVRSSFWGEDGARLVVWVGRASHDARLFDVPFQEDDQGLLVIRFHSSPWLEA